MQINNIFDLGELFEQVQLKKIFEDGKTFVDCTPKAELAFIRERYEDEKTKHGFDLAAFVYKYFQKPAEAFSDYKSDNSLSVKEHTEQLWPFLTRKPHHSNDSLITLPHDYIVPGGRFREIYYWDSFFTMLGLQVSGRVDMIENMIDNFSYLINKIGYIPNGNRTYYLGRSQPPFFACMVQLLSEEKGKNILIKYLPHLEKEYQFWMRGTDALTNANSSVNRVALMDDGNILNHYWDENDTPRPESFKEDIELSADAKDKKIVYRHLRAAAESGWDFSSRWFKDGDNFSTIHTTEIIPVDLNCLLYNLEKAIAEAFDLSGKKDKANEYLTLAHKRKIAINKYCWSSDKNFYYDYDYVAFSFKNSLTLAALFPLYFKLASDEQAEFAAKKIEKDFLKNGGVITTITQTMQQWDAPNGWAPLQWITVIGLKNYGYRQLADDIAKRWMRINENVYHNTGKMMEKYNVVKTGLVAGGGEYDAQDGFGWTNGVYLFFNKMIR